MQHIAIPVSDLMRLIVDPGTARISNDNNHMMVVVENDLHILVGDFTSIDSSEKLEEIIKRNL